jgi:hypothetical protein
MDAMPRDRRRRCLALISLGVRFDVRGGLTT